MRHMDINSVIAWGLVIMGNIAVGGWIALSIVAGTSSGTEIPIAVISSLGGVLTGKHITERKYEGWQPPENQKEEGEALKHEYQGDEPRI